MNTLLRFIYIPILIWAAINIYSDYQESENGLRELREQVESEEIRVRKKKKELLEIQEFKKDLDKSKQSLNSIEEQVTDLRRKLPAVKDSSGVLQLIGSAATDLQIRSQNISIGNEENYSDYTVENYIFSSQATFPQLIVLLERIKNSSRIFDFSTIEIKKRAGLESQYNYLDLKIVLSTYRYSTNGSQIDSTDDTESYEEDM